MSYKAKSIELLNKSVAEELTAVHQYMYFHFHLEDMGYVPLAKLFHRISIVEMIHVEELAERILFLGGDVDMKVSHNTKKITDVEKMLEYAVELETESVNDYNERAKAIGELKDSATKRVFESLVETEEQHQDIFETELDNLRRYGDKYLSLQAHEFSREVADGNGEAE